MKFNHLNVPETWQHYWSKYPEGYTILEALLNWVAQVDSMVDNQNDLNTRVTGFRTELDEFIAQFDTNLQGQVEDTLSEWQTSGFLDVVINAALQTQIDEVDARLSADLADNAISPEKFTGTDVQKVQSALDYALSNNVAVKFAKMYDITGNTLLINRPDLYYATDRKQLYLIGVGGGIKKTDVGFMFDATYRNTGDINVSDLKIESIAGAGTKIWNGDKIIRVKSSNNQYRNVDTILSALTEYTQSMYFSNEHITGGKGWKFEAKMYFDIVIDRCLVEDGEHFIRNTETLNAPVCYSLRISSNLIENMSGTTAMLGAGHGLTLSDNYVEYNGAYFDLESMATRYSHIGLNITGNSFFQTEAQKTAKIPCIKLKNTNEASAPGNGGCFSYGNSVTGGVLYDLTNMVSESYVTGVNDFGEILNPARYIAIGKPYVETLADGFTMRSFGTSKVFYKQFFISLVPANTDTVLDITVPFDLKRFMNVNVMQGSDSFVLKNLIVDDTNNRIKIVYTNTHPTAALNVNPRLVISELYI